MFRVDNRLVKMPNTALASEVTCCNAVSHHRVEITSQRVITNALGREIKRRGKRQDRDRRSDNNTHPFNTDSVIHQKNESSKMLKYSKLYPAFKGTVNYC
jgi:hypothetical protein